MYLKKLIISGFKSFADKVTLNFDHGITGIVGPNGSGKSNVIDAVRWVMGEQNAKQLRGQVATDIIFAGSEKRKPLATAEVTLVFDNSEASPFSPPEYRHEPEISLTRRLYVDGGRDYLINKKPCRLKDIVGFFATTGLGGRSYSMIQQGQVDRILNAKPEDVREILEEAAGTLVFKARRLEAGKKLEATRENLSRIEDIVAELKRQLENLEEQVDKAKKWKEISEQLRDEELGLLAHQFKRYDDKHLSTQDELDKYENEEAGSIAKLSTLEAKQTELQNQLESADPELEGLREKITEIREQIARAESTISNSITTIENNEKRIIELDTEITRDDEHLSEVQKQLDQTSEKLSSALASMTELRSQMDDFQDEVDSVDESSQVFHNKMDDLADEIKNLDLLLQSNGLRCEAIERDRKRLSEDLREMESKAGTLRADLAASAAEYLEIEQSASNQKSGLDKILVEKRDIEQTLSDQSEQMDELRTLHDEAKEKYFEARADLNSLEQSQLANEDISQIAAILKDDPVPGVKGLLTEFIKLKPEASELSPTALSAFEKWSERLLVDTTDGLNAIAAIANDNDISGFPILLNDSRTETSSASEAWAETYDAQCAVDFLEISEDRLKSFFKNVYFLSTLNLGEDEMRSMPSQMLVFTSQGLAIAGGGQVRVGGKRIAGALSKKNLISDKAAELKAYEGRLAKTQGELDQLKTRQSELQLRLSELDDLLKEQNESSFEVLSQLQKIKQERDHKTSLLKDAEERIERINSQQRQFVEELEELGQTRISLGSERETLMDEQAQIKEEAEAVEERREEVMRVHDARRMAFAKAETEHQAIADKHHYVEAQLKRIQDELSRKYEEKDRIKSAIDQAHVHEEECKAEIASYIARREEYEDILSEKREENSGIINELKAVEAELKGVRETYNEIQKKRSAFSVDLERTRSNLDGVLDKARENYHIDLRHYEFEFDPKFPTEQKARKVASLRSKLDSMGPINMMAIEEYDTLSERYHFITAQREEVFGSIDLLEEAIAEIEETSKIKFMDTFEVINREFAELFPILFPSGDARLELTDESDPLNAGVDIMVRLPGKKQQRLNLFSGGEKALTAISLIFALLKTKPTPFCFLDEVDAPLDEANVGRYNRVLEALADRFQFIVITHNRRTMEVLDQLYGVTMQEAGVSKVVGVDMQKDLPAHLKKAFKEEEKAVH